VSEITPNSCAISACWPGSSSTTGVERLTGQLSAIVDNIAKVSEVAPDVPATSHPIPLENVFRPDVVGEMLTVEQVLQNAPDATDDRFKVTAILGRSSERHHPADRRGPPRSWPPARCRASRRRRPTSTASPPSTATCTPSST
jgi:aspartyl-tRNA(Asn)/glutamyl-tRNA(Gln) amidotransferase subunit C